jgi:DNA-3-methyladenine glycosylase
MSIKPRPPTAVQPAPLRLRPLPRAFYARDTVAVARDLLGKVLVRDHAGVQQVGRIVEVEAYLGPHDLASHSSRGLTKRNQAMFGPPGHAYVYLIYGMHFCMNVVTEAAGHGSAVLLRAIEPVRNIEGRTQGPGLLCRAMHIDRALDGHDLLGGGLYIATRPEAPAVRIVRSRRIGVDYAGTWARRLLRFSVQGSPFVSRR